jgi:hypothetical protein
MHQLVYAGTGFARASVAGDEPAATELIPLPLQTAEPRGMAFAISRNEQEENCDERQKNPTSRQEVLRIPQREHEVWWRHYRTERNEAEFHFHALPIR